MDLDPHREDSMHEETKAPSDNVALHLVLIVPYLYQSPNCRYHHKMMTLYTNKIRQFSTSPNLHPLDPPSLQGSEEIPKLIINLAVQAERTHTSLARTLIL